MIFILGGGGFVGSAMVRACKAQGREYKVIDSRNYSNYVGKSCDIFINANGNSKKFLAKEKPLQEFDASVRSVRASLVDFKYGYYVYLSSCDVYPDCSSHKTTREDMVIDVSRQSPYGFHKYLAEQCVQHAALKWLVLRMGGFIGPGLRKNPIYDILHGAPLWLDPESEMQFLHTDVNARIILSLIDKGFHNEVFNICGKGVVKLSEVIETLGNKVPVKLGSPRLRYEVDIKKVLAYLDIPETRGAVLQFIRE